MNERRDEGTLSDLAAVFGYPVCIIKDRHPLWPYLTDLSHERNTLLAHMARVNASFDPLRRETFDV